MHDYTKLFCKETCGQGHYRIPSIITTKHGTVVTAVDERFYGCGDNPNRIDKIVRRSKDNGKSWEEKIVVVEEVGNEKMKASAAIDPALLYDSQNDRIFMLYDHTPAGVGILSSRRGIGETAKGERLVYSGSQQYVVKGDTLYKDDEATQYKCDDKGNVYDGATYKGNYYVGDGEFKELETFFLMLCWSDDDGLTWSNPVCLNHQVKRANTSFLGVGPGIGIQIQNGKYKGRLVYPIYYNTGPGRNLWLSCAVIYSDDGGKTWNMGDTPNNNRKRLGIFNVKDKFLFPNECLTESQVIECRDGHLRIFMRNHAMKKRVAIADSYDGGESWQDFRFNDQLLQCICQLSIIQIDDGGRPATIFLNAATTNARKRGVVRLSYDDGETWEYGAIIREDEFVYSSMAQFSDGEIGIIYEPSTQHESVDFVKITTKWIKENNNA